jgi:hypothetical protein
MFLDCFDILILKTIFFKKNYFNIFPSEKHFKIQSLLHSQINTEYLTKQKKNQIKLIFSLNGWSYE